MIEILLSLLLLAGAVVILLAAIGLIRLPDLPTRMHATTKSGVLATMLIMIAVALYFTRGDVTARVLSIIMFTFLTAPIAAHAIGRAGYLSGVKLWSETQKDDLQEYYQNKAKKDEHSRRD